MADQIEEQGQAADRGVLNTGGPIDFGGLSDFVAERLREAILSGHLRDGQHVVERTLSAELGVSRGPIRDALRKLEAEGLVVVSPRRGARVATMTPDDAEECIAIREGIEPIAVRFMLQRDRPWAVQALQAIVEKLEDAAARGDWSAVVLLDMEFHGRIYSLAEQRRLLRIWEGMRVPLLQTFRLHRQFYGQIEEVPKRHRELLAVFAEARVAKAEAAARDHVTEFLPQLMTAMRA